MNHFFLFLKDLLHDLKDSSSYLLKCSVDVVVKLIIGWFLVKCHNRFTNWREAFVQWRQRRFERQQAATAVAQSVIVEEQSQYFLQQNVHHIRRDQENMRKLALKVLCFVMVALIVSRLFTNSKEAKAQMFGFMLLLMIAIFVGSGMLDKLIERAKEQGLLDNNNNKQIN